MIPAPYSQLALFMHQERIRAAEAPRPEWWYEAALTNRLHHTGARTTVAQMLHRLAAAIDPASSAWQHAPAPRAEPSH